MFKMIIFSLILSTPVLAQYRETYKCEKGEKIILYRISFKENKSEPPCKVYEKYQDQKTRRIAFSARSQAICEEALNRTLKRCLEQGMECTQID